jgi:predicted DNA-binding transcriptional regulator AlpA
MPASTQPKPHAVLRIEVYVESWPDAFGSPPADQVEAITAAALSKVASQLGVAAAATPSTIAAAERAIGAEEVGKLLGLSPRTVLETVACRADFPVRLTMRPATWVAGEVLAWRDANRVGRQARPRQRRRRNG